MIIDILSGITLFVAYVQLIVYLALNMPLAKLHKVCYISEDIFMISTLLFLFSYMDENGLLEIGVLNISSQFAGNLSTWLLVIMGISVINMLVTFIFVRIRFKIMIRIIDEMIIDYEKICGNHDTNSKEVNHE